MNQRIKILAKQAYEDVIKNTPSFLVTKELYEQKFAELIVQECAEVVKWTPSVFPNDTIIKNIKEHFGVEE
jgi:hypothetical protein